MALIGTRALYAAETSARVSLAGAAGGGNTSSSHGVYLIRLPNAHPTTADGDRDRAERRILLRDRLNQRPFRGLPLIAQHRDRAAIAARAVDLPAERAVCRGDLDNPPRVGVHDLVMQRGLHVGVAPHRATERGEIAG